MMQAHVAEYKKEVVSNLVELARKYPIIGVVNMESMPAPQLQNMRAQLRKNAVLTMTKRRIIKIAFQQAAKEKKGLESLNEHLGGMPALIFTNENPFRLSRTLDKSKSPAPAKAGQIAPNDITIHKGPTPFAPGPFIAELSMTGIKSGIEGGKIAIKEDTVVAKKGDKIKPKVAEILLRLGIQPMEVGL
ncbi:50S ribosomal protein L10, partial [Candidatus Woesearchaeota archaeon]|nr:50S ribosomal protein L10 [Candidatus Woesearchaeota archaeon]